jgi:hypothetical protein
VPDIPCSCRHGVLCIGEHVLDRVGLPVLNVDGTDEEVVGDVVQVATELEPGAGHGDVVGRALALDLRRQETQTCINR